MFTATKKQQHYLKQLAALQFPGSIDNLSTRLPIYALEQQLPKDDAGCLVSGKRARCSWYSHRANIQGVQLPALRLVRIQGDGR